MRKMVILLLLLTITGCGQNESGNKTEADAHPAQNTSLNGQFGAGPQSDEEKLAGLKQKAESGDAKSQLALARMHYNGGGMAKDDIKAAELYQKAAEQGNAMAQYNLGMMYQKGEGVTRDAAKAEEWLQKAAAQGLK